jgi:hypothetical protein
MATRKTQPQNRASPNTIEYSKTIEAVKDNALKLARSDAAGTFNGSHIRFEQEMGIKPGSNIRIWEGGDWNVPVKLSIRLQQWESFEVLTIHATSVLRHVRPPVFAATIHGNKILELLTYTSGPGAGVENWVPSLNEHAKRLTERHSDALETAVRIMRRTPKRKRA